MAVSLTVPKFGTFRFSPSKMKFGFKGATYVQGYYRHDGTWVKGHLRNGK